MNLVNAACKTDRFVSCRTVTVAKTKAYVFVIAEIFSYAVWLGSSSIFAGKITVSERQRVN